MFNACKKANQTDSPVLHLEVETAITEKFIRENKFLAKRKKDLKWMPVCGGMANSVQTRIEFSEVEEIPT
jgi:hypothetical protein